MNEQKITRTVGDVLAAAFLRSEAQPGWVFEPVADGTLLVAVTPWPFYGEAGTPAWQMRVLRVPMGGAPARRYTIPWSTRLGRWAVGNDADRMQRDLSPDQLLALHNHMLDTLEGALA